MNQLGGNNELSTRKQQTVGAKTTNQLPAKEIISAS
jgi:hypothetical protein